MAVNFVSSISSTFLDFAPERKEVADAVLGPADFKKWLEVSHPRLKGAAAVDLIKTAKWKIVADLIDEMLTGSPT